MNLILTRSEGTRSLARAVTARGSFASQPVVYVGRQGAPLRAAGRTLVEVEFRKHERKWKRDTQFVSSLSEKYLHPSYARIISLGRPVVPLILRSLKKEPDDWFYALRAITGQNVVPPSAAGDMPRMTDLWLKWGAERGLISHGEVA